MPSFLSVATFVASAGMVMAAPAEILGRATFQVEQVKSPRQVLKSGPLSMMKTYAKFSKIGAQAPSFVVAAAAAVQSGSVANNPTLYDSEYICPVTCGSTKMNLDFDTGSSDLWVFSTKTPTNERTGHDLYSPSTSAKLLSGQTWSISYGDGSGASGIVYADKVVIGSVTATSQAVEVATAVSAGFVSDTSSDGLLGLAFSDINTVTPNQQTTFFDTVGSSLAKKLFTADLKAGKAGTYGFGYIDSSKYTGSIAYTAVDNSQGYWGFTAGAGGPSSASGSSIGSSIADTGTTLIYLPTANVQAYYAKLSGASNSQSMGGWIFPCSASPPAFVVKIGSGTFTVPGSYINFGPVDNTGTICFGGIQDNSGFGLTIFGDIFLKSVFAIFDESTGAPRLGFASKNLS